MFLSCQKEETLNTFYERMITIPITAISSLKKELVTMIGEERSKGIFIRYGYHSGVSDGEKAMACKWSSIVELIEAGPKFHILHGYLDNVVIDAMAFAKEDDLESIDITWYNSFEAAEFLKDGKTSNEPVCHTMCGYASGYLSKVLQRPIIVKETKCRAMGYEACEATCMPLENWGPELEKELRYYQSTSMIQELDEITEKLKIERDYLRKANEVHCHLIEKLLSKQGLDAIVQVLYQATNLPTFIENENNEIIEQSEDVKIDFELENLRINKTEFIEISSKLGILRTPVYFEQEIKGYCSFIYTDQRKPNDLEYMFIYQASLTAAIILLNENIRIHTEQNIRRGFLNDILDNRLAKEELYKIAHYLEFNPNDSYWMLTLKRNMDSTKLNQEIEMNEELVQHINAFFQQRRVNAIVAQKSGEIIIVIEHSSFKEIFMKKAKFIQLLLKHCTRRFKKYTFFVGVSSVVQSIDQLSTLYNESLVALQTTSPKKQVQYFEELGIESVLFQIPDEALIDRFVQKQVGALLEADKDYELVKTLYAFIENGININMTAKATAMSISGLRYRLEKISDILNIDLNDTPSLFSIYMALNILKTKGEINI